MPAAPVLLALALITLNAQAQDAATSHTVQARESAPPLPFRYVGKLTQNGKSEVLLMRGVILHCIAEGDEIDGEYRVERITGAAIRFIYLPSRVRQVLDLTAARR